MKQVCIVGVGNIIRSDDGIGEYICETLEAMHLPGVTTITVHQLDAEIVETLLPYDYVIIVDASVTEDDVELYELDARDAQPTASSHYLNATMIIALAQKVYNRQLAVSICAVSGENFEVGDTLSPKAEVNCLTAIDLIKSKLAELQP